MKLSGGSPQACKLCVLGVKGKSKMDHCYEVSFWRASLWLGW